MARLSVEVLFSGSLGIASRSCRRSPASCRARGALETFARARLASAKSRADREIPAARANSAWFPAVSPAPPLNAARREATAQTVWLGRPSRTPGVARLSHCLVAAAVALPMPRSAARRAGAGGAPIRRPRPPRRRDGTVASCAARGHRAMVERSARGRVRSGRGGRCRLRSRNPATAASRTCECLRLVGIQRPADPTGLL